MSEAIRYGYYLRPSAAMCAAQSQIHTLLERQFGLRVAGRFMPHCTIKGFFKSEVSETRVREIASTITDGVAPFEVHNNGIVGWGTLASTISIMFNPDGSRNESLQHLHQRAIDALLPIVAPDCNFTGGEWYGDRFHAHLTLAMADIPAARAGEILEFCQELEPIGPPSFTAEWLHLYAFESTDWRGEWWRDFRWTLCDSWRLTG
ncbi:MAG: 2'-5' RNA ligase family protein [Thermomicrobiales bacterium]